MGFTNDEFIELVQSFLKELRPTTALKVGLGRTEKEGQAVSEYLFMRVISDGDRTVTEVRFKKSDLVGLSEAHIKVFLTTKLAAIGVSIAEVEERAKMILGETAEEFDGGVTAVEVDQLRAMSQRRNLKAPGQKQAAAKVEQQLKADPANVTQKDLDALKGVVK